MCRPASCFINSATICIVTKFDNLHLALHVPISYIIVKTAAGLDAISGCAYGLVGVVEFTSL